MIEFVSPAAPKAREILKRPQSVTFSFPTAIGKYFSKLCRYVYHVMGVCCIVFDIDRMLFEFFMNF